MKQKATIYTAEGLAEALNKSYSRLRAILQGKNDGDTLEGFKLRRLGSSWLAYKDSTLEVEIIDASPETKEKNKQYRLKKPEGGKGNL